MKSRLTLIFVALGCILGCTQPKSVNTTQTSSTTTSVKEIDKPETEKIVEVIKVDLNDDGKTDTITLTLPNNYGDPGSFNKAYISLAGSVKKTLNSKGDAWDKVDDYFAGKNTNAVKSNRVFVYKKPGVAFVLLFGYVFGSGGNEFTVIQIKNNLPNMVFDGAMDYPEGFADVNHDDKIEFLGKESSSEELGHVDSLNADILTYDPYKVYNIDNEFEVDNALTQKYNEENYVWAGLHPKESIKVLVPKNGDKPTILK